MPTAPSQAYDYHLNPVKGWPNPAALDFSAKINSSVAYDLRAGQVVHLNSAGTLEPGCKGKQMPLFLFQGAAEYDVNNASSDQWIPIQPSGAVMCIVATAAVELETTEFVSGLTYAPNDHLKSTGSGITSSDEALTNKRPTSSSSGVLTNNSVTLYTNTVVGVVSRGLFTNYNKKQMLAFWPVYIPGSEAS
jgi:hypothetical protein